MAEIFLDFKISPADLQNRKGFHWMVRRGPLKGPESNCWRLGMGPYWKNDLFGCNELRDLVEMSSSWIRVGPKSHIRVLTREGEKACVWGGRVKTEAEAGGMRPQAREAGSHQKPEETRKGPPLEPLEGAQPLISDVRSPELRENKFLAFLKSPTLPSL